MVNTDETGKKQLDEVIDSLATGDWTSWEEAFIEDIRDRNLSYQALTTRQKGVVDRLWTKLHS